MQLCEQGLARHGTALALATIPPAPAVGAPAGALDPVFALIAAHKQIMETVRATAAEIRHSTEDEASAMDSRGFDIRRTARSMAKFSCKMSVVAKAAGVGNLAERLARIERRPAKQKVRGMIQANGIHQFAARRAALRKKLLDGA